MFDLSLPQAPLPGGFELPNYTPPVEFGSLSNWGMPASPLPAALTANAPSAAAATADPSMWQNMQNWMKTSGFLGSKDANGIETQGWGGLALGGLQGVANLWMGMQQYNLAKETLAQNKEQFNRNYEAQRTTTNTALEDRQRARVASNPGAYQSVSSYMDQNRVR